MTQVRATVDLVRNHLQALHIGSEVTRWFRKEREPHVLKVTPENVLAALHGVGINCVLMGAHGINVYRDEARASQDVDVLVTKKDVRKAVRILERTFPYLEVTENSSVARFLNPVTQKVVIDVMKPSSRATQAVFRNTVAIGDSYRIPNLEMALVSKFVAMNSSTRRADKRHLDVADFTNIVLTNRKILNVLEAQRIAEKVRRGGGAMIVELIGEIDAGRTINL
jgi:hypothetical protein